jgi:peptidoglycan hydrolase CwlO-like protein
MFKKYVKYFIAFVFVFMLGFFVRGWIHGAGKYNRRVVQGLNNTIDKLNSDVEQLDRRNGELEKIIKQFEGIVEQEESNNNKIEKSAEEIREYGYEIKRGLENIIEKQKRIRKILREFREKK